MKKIYKSLLISFSLVIAATFTTHAADSTVVVTPPSMATSILDVVARPTSWLFYNDETDVIDNTLGSFIAGPSTPPVGAGSVQISVSGTQRRNLATYRFSGTPLADITTLKFSTYNPSAGNGGSVDRSGYLHFNADFNGTDTWQRRLVFVPSLNGTVVQNSWQEWDAIQGGDAKWLYSGDTWPVTGEPGTSTKTWTQVLADYPGVRVRVTDSFLGVRVGEPYADGYTENIDAFKFGTAAGITTFDFDPYVAPSVPIILSPLHNAIVTASNMDKVDWSDSTGTNTPFEYQYEAFGDAGYSGSLYLSGWLANSEIPTLGTPPGDYYVRVRARDNVGTETAWSNGSTNPHKITVIADPTPTPDPYTLPVACAETGYTYGSPIIGTDESNSINGTSGNDLIFALGGSDIVNGGGGNDCIVGGSGSDTLRGGNGKDVLLGEDGTDSLDGGNHEDKLYGGDGADSLKGGNESDMLFGQNGNDSLDGGNGNDTLLGGDGNDSMRGANGMDSLDGEIGNDSANGGSGNQDSCTAESESACEL